MLDRNRFEEIIMPVYKEGDKPATPTGTDVSVCANFGLNTEANQSEFAAKFGQLQQNWRQMSGQDRINGLQGLSNEQLAKTGVPRVPMESAPLNSGGTSCGHIYGAFDPAEWKMQIASDDLSAQELNAKDAGELADTTYHEPRHAEQYYLVARLQAANMQKFLKEVNADMPASEQADIIHEQVGIPNWVAARAQQDPLPENAPERACAEALKKTLMTDQNTTNQTEQGVIDAFGADCAAKQESERAGAALAEAQGRNAPDEELQHLQETAKTARENAEQLHSRAQEAFVPYRNLFHEADAFATAAPVHRTIDPDWQQR